MKNTKRQKKEWKATLINMSPSMYSDVRLLSGHLDMPYTTFIRHLIQKELQSKAVKEVLIELRQAASTEAI